MTYWLLNLWFLVPAALVFVAAVAVAARRGGAGHFVGAVAGALIILLAFTAVFDNVMIGIGLVAYDPARISGAFLGAAPLEDFAYAIAAGLLLPSLWVLLGRRNENR
ncbi:hypothetical protein ALI44B_10805 [Leifsonia sp. ALI-44-B]|uniref:lycopene cyclase domain-containing protein n=1 Tax=Leifsonia sp. ALI-44-B TaxID=1933776 RepID=UPI00097CAE69|nr:lycopene cyclase domain-containing protein [Leifsonia sp. ALI-44-B]ONI61000.1 hypothetical protein ALI44B_10805 [Leifsonia sp. ALI-44-B]